MDTKKGNIIFWSIIAAIVLIIGIAALTKSLSDSNDISVDEIEATAVTTYDRYYYPGDFEIESLKNVAENFEGYDYSHYLENLELPLKENHLLTAEEYPPIISIYSPQSVIVREAYQAAQKMNQLSVEELREKSDIGETIIIQTTAYRNFADSFRKFHVVLRQGDTVLQPGGDGYVSTSSKKNVSYYKGVVASEEKYTREEANTIFVPGKEIDFEKPVEVVFLYNGKDDYAVYELDFKKFIQ
nr:hypothetical protein [Paenibacillus xylanexedens]